MKTHLIAAAVLAAVSISVSAGAATVYSTGRGPATQNGWVVDLNQWLAMKFTTTTDYTVTDITAWLAGTGPFTLGIAQGALPGPYLYSKSFVGGLNTTGYPGAADWNGIHDLDWDLSAGAYWIVIESPVANHGSMPSPWVPSGAVTASSSNGGLSWSFVPAAAGLDLGFDVEGVAAPVPEPSEWAMMGAGLAIVTAALRRRDLRRG